MSGDINSRKRNKWQESGPEVNNITVQRIRPL